MSDVFVLKRRPLLERWMNSYRCYRAAGVPWVAAFIGGLHVATGWFPRHFWSSTLWVLFAFALMVAYWPEIAGVATTPRWDVAAVLAIVWFFAPRIEMRAAHWLGLALAGWLIASLFWSEGFLDGIDSAAKIVMVGVAFAVGSTLVNIEKLAIGAALGLSVSSAVAIAQWFGWDGIPSYAHPAGLFYNGDRLASVAALVIVACLALRIFRVVPALLPAMLLPQSRLAVIATLAGLASVLWVRRHTLTSKNLIGLAASFTLLGIACAAIVIQRGLHWGVADRLDLYQDTLAGLTWLGHGLGSFWNTFPAYAHHFDLHESRPDHPHSEWLWLAYEGGALGLVLGLGCAAALGAAGLHLRGANSAWDDRDSRAAASAVLLTLFVESLFAMPFHDPATVIFGALCAGYLSRRRDRVLVVADPGGNPLRAWVARSEPVHVSPFAVDGADALPVHSPLPRWPGDQSDARRPAGAPLMAGWLGRSGWFEYPDTIDNAWP